MLGGMGDQVAMGVQQGTAGVLAIALGFWRGPALAGVVLSFLPAMMLAIGSVMPMLKGGAMQQNEDYARAGELAAEAISSIRTVSSSCGEGAEVERYSRSLTSAQRAGTCKAFAMGAGFGGLWFFMSASRRAPLLIRGLVSLRPVPRSGCVRGWSLVRRHSGAFVAPNEPDLPRRPRRVRLLLGRHRVSVRWSRSAACLPACTLHWHPPPPPPPARSINTFFAMCGGGGGGRISPPPPTTALLPLLPLCSIIGAMSLAQVGPPVSAIASATVAAFRIFQARAPAPPSLPTAPGCHAQVSLPSSAGPRPDA